MPILAPFPSSPSRSSPVSYFRSSQPSRRLRHFHHHPTISTTHLPCKSCPSGNHYRHLLQLAVNIHLFPPQLPPVLPCALTAFDVHPLQTIGPVQSIFWLDNAELAKNSCSNQMVPIVSFASLPRPPAATIHYPRLDQEPVIRPSARTLGHKATQFGLPASSTPPAVTLWVLPPSPFSTRHAIPPVGSLSKAFSSSESCPTG
ncbi:MAG: hypothetical protein Q9206_000788 [Seirophora lacunosa]